MGTWGVVVFLAVFFAIGIGRVVSDRLQPVVNQPDYVRDPRWWSTLICVVLWPVLLCSDVVFFIKRRRRRP